MPIPRSEHSDLPEPSPELILLGVFVQAYISTHGPKKGERFLREAASVFEQYESFAEVIPIRRKDEHAAIAASRRTAYAWFRQMLGVYMAKL
jgi:hypothetical protein